MSTVNIKQPDGPDIQVNLREPYIAAILAWLWPGAGHFYQRRFTKAFIFMVCILGTYFYGLGLARGRCVYVSWKENDKRWQYAFQVGVGAPALPAIIQSVKTKNGGDPFFVIAERWPKDSAIGADQFAIIKDRSKYDTNEPIIKDGLMAPPFGKVELNNIDTLGAWHRDLQHKFEIGTLFTIIAGVLNLLAVYDAFAGPAIMRDEKKKKRRSRAEKRKDDEPPPDDDGKEAELKQKEDKETEPVKKSPGAQKKGPKPRSQKRKRK